MTVTEQDYVADDVTFWCPDPLHAWTEDDGLPVDIVAWAERDDDGNPHDDFEHTQFVAEGYDYAYGDCPELWRIVQDHRDNYTYDEKLLRKSIRKALRPLALERFDFGDYGQGTMWAIIPDMTAAELLGDAKYWDAAKWLHHAQDRKHLKAYAKKMLKADIEAFKVWDEEGAFFIRAGNLRTGEMSDGTGGVVDPYPYEYALEVAKEEAILIR